MSTDRVSCFFEMVLSPKHRKLIYLSIASVILVMLGMAAGSWAVATIKGDAAVADDIDQHFQTVDKQNPHSDPTRSKAVLRPSSHAPNINPSSSSRPVRKASLNSGKPKFKSGTKQPPQNAAPEPNPWPGIVEVAPSTYSIDEQLFNAARAQPQSFVQGARAVLTQKDSAPIGFQLFGISRQSALFAIGLRNRDILIAVNGHMLGSIDEALLAASALKIATKFRVDILRGKRNFSFYYRVAENKK